MVDFDIPSGVFERSTVYNQLISIFITNKLGYLMRFPYDHIRKLSLFALFQSKKNDTYFLVLAQMYFLLIKYFKGILRHIESSCQKTKQYDAI